MKILIKNNAVECSQLNTSETNQIEAMELNIETDNTNNNNSVSNYDNNNLTTNTDNIDDFQSNLGNLNSQFMPKCPLCDKTFANSSNLKHHMNTIHFNEAKWICNECGKVCTSKSNLKVHLRVHLRVKPYYCRWCDYNCMHHSSIRDHLSKVHPDKSHNSCEPGYVFNSAAVPEPESAHVYEKNCINTSSSNALVAGGDASATNINQKNIFINSPTPINSKNVLGKTAKKLSKLKNSSNHVKPSISNSANSYQHNDTYDLSHNNKSKLLKKKLHLATKKSNFINGNMSRNFTKSQNNNEHEINMESEDANDMNKLDDDEVNIDNENHPNNDCDASSDVNSDDNRDNFNHNVDHDDYINENNLRNDENCMIGENDLDESEEHFNSLRNRLPFLPNLLSANNGSIPSSLVTLFQQQHQHQHQQQHQQNHLKSNELLFSNFLQQNSPFSQNLTSGTSGPNAHFNNLAAALIQRLTSAALIQNFSNNTSNTNSSLSSFLSNNCSTEINTNQIKAEASHLDNTNLRISTDTNIPCSKLFLNQNKLIESNLENLNSNNNNCINKSNKSNLTGASASNDCSVSGGNMFKKQKVCGLDLSLSKCGGGGSTAKPKMLNTSECSDEYTSSLSPVSDASLKSSSESSSTNKSKSTQNASKESKKFSSKAISEVINRLNMNLPNAVNNLKCNKDENDSSSSSSSTSSSSTSHTSSSNCKNNQHSLELDDNNKKLRLNLLDNNEINLNDMILKHSTSAPVSPNTNLNFMKKTDGSNYKCKFCNIIFNEYSLYSIHAGMHSNSNPWQCNVCGHVCSNKIDFAVHILHLSKI